MHDGLPVSTLEVTYGKNQGYKCSGFLVLLRNSNSFGSFRRRLRPQGLRVDHAEPELVGVDALRRS